MTILQEILEWSQGLSNWQQDAMARLYENGGLTTSDLEDVYALAKTEAGIADPKGRTPRKLQGAQVAPAPVATRHVVLNSIHGVRNVNALAEEAHIPFASAGLTCIYGENGVGKSGYSRVLKKACRARDKREQVLPNANQASAVPRRAQATFHVTIDGSKTDLVWVDGEDPPEELSEISIFDSHCARAYIDNQGDFAYRPYGLDILHGLVAACNTIKSWAITEKQANAANTSVYESLRQGGTEVARRLQGIPGETTASDIEDLARLSGNDAARLSILEGALAEPDPKQKAVALRQKASRLNLLKQRICAAIGALSDEKVTEVRGLIEKSNATRAAAELAAESFKAAPGQLPGTGGEEWKALFDAARTFAAVSHPDFVFPELPAESQCPLCQNALGDDGVIRLRKFDAFVQAAAEKAARDAKATAIERLNAIQQAHTDLQLESSLVDELRELSPKLSDECVALQRALLARKEQVIGAAGGGVDWDSVTGLLDPTPSFDPILDELESRAQALDASADQAVRDALVAEFNELDARRRLADIKDAVLEVIAKAKLCQQLEECIQGMDTRSISRKATELSRTTASAELAEALNAELKALKIDHIRAVMRPESPGGSTRFKLVLELPGGGTPAAILSEGEQRALAIASFLAEITVGKGRGGVVFDDPVSSLDHRRRWEVAERLAREALVRQVVVFTHDIYFLHLLERKAEAVGVDIASTFIRRTPAGYGVHSEDLPFELLGTKARIGRLREMLVDVGRAAKSGDEELQRNRTSELYRQLRLAWERCVEEVLLNGAVQRFEPSVSTQRLEVVTITDDDYAEIEQGMTKSSTFVHDAANAVDRLPIPHPDEVGEDIERLDTWRKNVEKRVRDLRGRKITRASLFQSGTL